MNSIQNIKDRFNTYEMFIIFSDCMYMPTWEKFTNRAIEFINKDEINIFGFFEDKRIIGIIVIDHFQDEVFEVKGIAVDIKYRKRGIGKQLIRYACNKLSISVLVVETDGDAVEFYRHCGFMTEEFMKNGKYIRYKVSLM